MLDGKLEGKLEIIKIMTSKGLSAKAIAELTGLAENDIEKLN